MKDGDPMSDHLDPGRLVDLAREPGRIGEAERAHLEACETCAEARRWADAVLEAASAEPLGVPPAAVVERALSIPDEQPAPARREAPRWSLARWLPGLLPAAAGVRGAASTRRLYDSDAGRVDVEVAPDPDDAERWRVTGRLEPAGGPAPGDALAVLWDGETLEGHAAGDEIGLFVLSGVRAGRYRLEVWSPAAGAAVRIDPFEVPPPEAP